MKDDGARGAEITVEDGMLPFCSDCQVKHAADLLAHIDPKSDVEKFEKAKSIYNKVTKEVGMNEMEAKDYQTIRELEHKFEDGLTVLRDLRHKLQANPGVDNPGSRKYLPHGLTGIEEESPETRRLLSRCIRKVEKKQCPKEFKSYNECKANPVAVCRSAIEK